MREIERRLCGCVYGSTSWATRDEAEFIAAALALGPGDELLEVGSGSGWPALYLALLSGCSVTLADLPVGGLRIAGEQASRDGIAGRCRAVVADAARLPFPDASFEIINQSDVLCCLVQKETVLSECRRVSRLGGRMSCSLIYVPPGLKPDDHARAVEAAPDFVEAAAEYPALFAASRWSILERRDLTEAFTRSATEKLHAAEDLRTDLERVLGGEELERRRARMSRRIEVLERGHLRRALFIISAVR
jgi:ubiquinone/menaquinone biosynthesis C-methylase UbiE